MDRDEQGKVRSGMRVAVLTTHPIQYQVPWFRLLGEQTGIDLTVFYCLLPDARQQGDGFGVEFQWDIPLLDGYRYRVLRNVARSPSVTAFGGCDTPEISAIVRDERFDALIVNGWVVKSCLQGLAACRRRGVPCMVRGESNVLRPRPWPVRLAHRLLLSQYAACLAIGKSNRAFYRFNGVPAARIFDAPYGVDNERFARAAARAREDRAGLRAGWGIPPDACVFLFSGKLIPKKRPMDVLKALEACVPRPGGAALHLLVAGEGEMGDACRAYAAERRLPVTWAGFMNQSEMPRAYAAADCLVLPSDTGETWGLVVNEAMACGLPVIVSDRVGCGEDLVEPGVTGEIYPVGDIERLARCMKDMAADAGRRQGLGMAAAQRVAGYTFRRAVDGCLDALRFVRARTRGAQP